VDEGALIHRFERELAAVDDLERRAEWRDYLRYHERRYATLVEVALRLLSSAASPRVLDVGPMFEVGLLRDAGATVDTLGFPHPLFPPRDGERHVELDLNAPSHDGNGSYDLVVMAEVIEHLHSSPVTVLRHVATWLRPGGAILLQTPNAVALHKRVRMLAGRNPLEPIRDDARNPGHFHEYTLDELREAAARAGLAVEGWRTENYFGASAGARAYAAAGRALPARLRHGITMWLRRPGRAARFARD
jgi:SAM-dependent methyltransferase